MLKNLILFILLLFHGNLSGNYIIMNDTKSTNDDIITTYIEMDSTDDICTDSTDTVEFKFTFPNIETLKIFVQNIALQAKSNCTYPEKHTLHQISGLSPPA